MKLEFYICKHCGNIIAKVHDSGVPVMCCGEPMSPIIPGTSDGAAEKHIPVFCLDGNRLTVTVGSVSHPMTAEHHIEWIAVQTRLGNQRKALDPLGKPEACFALCDGDEVEAVYAYCNLHGLWKA